MIAAKPKVSAIICTHNRAQYLGQAIDSLLAQKYNSFEVIVVDNASSDRTREVVEARLHNPSLKYVYEPQIGYRSLAIRVRKQPWERFWRISMMML